MPTSASWLVAVAPILKGTRPAIELHAEQEANEPEVSQASQRQYGHGLAAASPINKSNKKIITIISHFLYHRAYNTPSYAPRKSYPKPEKYLCKR